MPSETYLAEREALREIFPRGRFVEDEDGTCTVRALAKAWSRDHLYVQATGRLVGVFYVGMPLRYLSRVRDLVEEHLEADGEGVMYLRWTPALAKRLPMFSLKAVCNPNPDTSGLTRFRSDKFIEASPPPGCCSGAIFEDSPMSGASPPHHVPETAFYRVQDLQP